MKLAGLRVVATLRILGEHDLVLASRDDHPLELRALRQQLGFHVE